MVKQITEHDEYIRPKKKKDRPLEPCYRCRIETKERIALVTKPGYQDYSYAPMCKKCKKKMGTRAV